MTPVITQRGSDCRPMPVDLALTILSLDGSSGRAALRLSDMDFLQTEMSRAEASKSRRAAWTVPIRDGTITMVERESDKRKISGR
jgi:hypothetical protein